MRLEFEPNVTAFPLVENEMFDELTVASDFQTILKNGIAAAQSGDREHARTLLVKAAAYEPRSEDAWMWLASISEYPEELLAFLNNVLNINPENERALEWRTATKALLAKTLVQRGVTSHNEGNSTLAAQCFDQALVHDNECEMAWFWKASLAPDDEQQVEFLNKVLSLNPENLEAQNALGMIVKARAQSTVDEAKAAAIAGDSTLALELLDKALSAAPDNVDAWVLRSHLSTVIQDKLEALAKVLELDPENAAARTSYDFLASTAKPAVVNPEQAEEKAEVEENVEASPVEADLAAETVEAHEDEPQAETVVDGKTEDFAFASAVTEDHEVDPPSESSDEAELAAEDYAYTQTVAFKADEATESVEEQELLDVGFISSATLGQKDMSEADPIHITEEPVESARSVDELFGPVEDPIDADRETVESVSPWDELAEPAAAEETENVSAAQTEDSNVEDSHDEFAGGETPVAFEMPEPAPEFIADESTVQFNPDENEPTYQVPEPAAEFVVDESSLQFAPDESHLTYEVPEPAAEFVAEASDEDSALAESPTEPEAAEQVEVLVNGSEQYHVEPAVEQESTSAATATTLIACPYCWEPNEPQAFECGSCDATLTLSDLESMLANNRCDREKVQHAVTQMEAEWNLREFDQREMKALALGHFNLHNYDTGMNYLQEALRLDPNDVILAGQLNTLAIRLDEIRRKEEIHDAKPKGKTILVVDDSATVRKLISGKLEKAGHAVVCAVDGVDGLARIDEQVPDLVLLDITMPRMDGYEVCKQIRANAAAKHVPIVMISGKDGFFDKVRGRMAGTTGYITKPFGPETLMKALETYLVNENGNGNGTSE